jgi:alpha-tubulin suppressor-like RCC1 family protein
MSRDCNQKSGSPRRLRRPAATLVGVVLLVGVLTLPSAPAAHASTGGAALAVGYNASGQLGNGTTADTDTFVASSIPSGTTVTAISGGGESGSDFSLALTSTGQVLAWGYNGFGRLGNGTTTDSHVPVSVSLPPGTTVTAISAGSDHGMALTSTGEVLAWGYNGLGQLGNGTTTSSSTPVAVSLPVGTTVTAIAAGAEMSMAITSTGHVLAWGNNSSGELGNGTTTSSDVPVSVSLPVGTTATAIAIGRSGPGSDHALALTSTGQVLAWGNNGFGALGNGTNTDSHVPVATSLPVGTTVTAISGGNAFSVAATSTGQALAWGRGFSGALGNGASTDSNVPVSVSLPAGTTVTAVSSGNVHSVARTSTGAVLFWGLSGGSDFPLSSTTPVGLPLPIGSTATAVAAGGFHDLALTTPQDSAPVFTADTPASTATVGTAYTYTFAASGSPAPTFTVSAGALPPGLSLNAATGGLSGTPTRAGSSTFTVTATNGVSPDAVSPSITIVVSGPTTTTASASPPNSTQGQPVSYATSVAPTSGGGTPTGTVLFKIGSTTLCTATLASGSGSCMASNAPIGTDTVTATYSGDAIFLTSANTTTETVTPAPPTVTSVSPTSGPSAGGTAVTVTGTNLTGATAVDFGATAATNVVVNGAGSSLTATSPAGTGTVNVTVTTPNGTSTGTAAQFTYVASSMLGYWLVAADGGIFTFGSAGFFHSMGGKHLNAPVVGMAAAPDGKGYWLVASDGGIFAFGDAGFYQSMGGKHLNAPIVGMAATQDGKGYWLVAADGGIFTFGDAGFFQSEGGKHLNAPIVGMAVSPDGQGYWLVAADGGVFAFGDAGFFLSMGSKHLNAPVVGMAAAPDGQGYWLVASDGGVFAFGDATFFGSKGGQTLNQPVAGMAATSDGSGYWLVAADGGIFNYGNAAFEGSQGGQPLNAPVVGMAGAPNGTR